MVNNGWWEEVGRGADVIREFRIRVLVLEETKIGGFLFSTSHTSPLPYSS